MKQHSLIFRDIRGILTSTFLSNILNFIRNFLVAKILGPYMTGLCMSIIAIPQASGYLNLGVIDALNFIIPNREGTGNNDIQDLKNQILTFCLIIASISIVLICSYIAIFPSQSPDVNAFILISAVLIIMGTFTRFFIADLSAERQFIRLGWVEFIYTLSLVLCVPLLFPWGAYGFWLGLIVSNLILILYCYREYLKRARIRFVRINMKRMATLIPLGIVMILSTSIYAPFMVITKIFLATTVGVLEVGYFTLSIIVISTFALIPRALSRVMLPHMSVMHAKNRDSAEIITLYKKAQIYTVALTLLAVGLALLLIDPIVQFLLPQYSPGIPAAKIMLLATLPYCLIDNANNILVVLVNKRPYLRILASVIFFQIAIFIFLKNMNFTIAHVSASLLIIFLVYALVLHLKIIKLQPNNSLQQ